MRLLDSLLVLTFFTSINIAHHADTNRHAALFKRSAARATSQCFHAKDCHHINIHGGRPRCHDGKCTFTCATSEGFHLSENRQHCVKYCVANEFHCSHDVPAHSKPICNSHGHCDFVCDKNYVKSSGGTACVHLCKHDSTCRTHVAHATAICLDSKRCGFKCNKNFKLSSDGRACSFHCGSNSACNKGHLSGTCNKKSGVCSYPTSISSSPIPTPTTVPSCNASFFLVGASESDFNKPGAPFSLQLTCPVLDTKNYTVLANDVPLLNTTNSTNTISIPGLTEAYVLLSVFALDSEGEPLLSSFALIFGTISKSVLVVDATGKPAPNVLVQANATIYPGLGQIATTDSSGAVTFINLIATTLSLIATTPNNQIAVAGIASTSAGDTTLTLIPFNSPASATALRKRSNGFVVSTAFSPNVQMVSKVFTPPPSAKTAYINYVFQTDEIPGGFFGTQFNDYFSLMIRSDIGASTFYTNSMNSLGFSAFDAGGATSNYTLTLDITGAKAVEFDVAVSNVGDALYQSQVIVNDYGNLTCNICDDGCKNCPGDPMCQPTCQNPPKSCSFYRTCAEAKVPCGGSGYALGFGEYFCNKYQTNIAQFTPAGRDWVNSVMSCLQKALIPILTCDPTCSSIKSGAFASHTACYVNAGVCNLAVQDFKLILTIVGKDPHTYDELWKALSQMVATGVTCVPTIGSRIQSYIDQLIKQEAQDAEAAAIKAAIDAVEIMRLYIERFGPL